MENFTTVPSSELVNWFISYCGIPSDRAEKLGKTLDEQCWINSIEALQQIIKSTPNFMDDLGLPKPIQVVLKNKLISYSNRDIVDLTAHQIQHLLEQLFPEESYGLQFRQNKINGTVLNVADGPNKLKEWGVNSMIHADALWLSLQSWKQSGVPLNQLPPDHTESASTETPLTQTHHKPQNNLKRSNESLLDHESAISKKSKTTSSNISESNASSKENHSNKERERISPNKSPPAQKGKLQRELAALLKSTPSREVNKEKEDKSDSIWIENSHRRVNAKESSAAATAPTTARKTKTLPVDKKESLSITSSPTELKETKKETKKTKKTSTIQAEDSTASSGGVTLLSRMRNLVAQLDSDVVDVQIKSLEAVSKQAVKHPDSVSCLRKAGVLDKLMDMLADANSLNEMVLWKTLVALNNIIARAKFIHAKYLVDRELIDFVVPLITDTNVKIRLQAVWIIGNLSVSTEEGSTDTVFKNMILNEELVDLIIESYDTVMTLEPYKGPDNVRQHYAETIKQLSYDRTREQFQLLHKLLPVLRDIIDTENHKEAITDACLAFEHLIDATDPDTIDALINADILPSLVNRLGDPKIFISENCLRVLKVFAECSTSQQVLEMENAISHLGRLIIGTPTHKPNKKLTLPATQCLIPICEGGDQSIQQLLDYAPDLYPILVERARSINTTTRYTDNEIAKNCGLSLMFSVNTSNSNQLDYLLSLGIYSLIFQLLEDCNDDLNMVKLIFRALSNILYKIENIKVIQVKEERLYSDYIAEDGWELIKERVKTLQIKNKKQSSDDEDEEEVVLEAKLARKAEKILSTAVRMELTTSASTTRSSSTSRSSTGSNVMEDQEQQEEEDQQQEEEMEI